MSSFRMVLVVERSRSFNTTSLAPSARLAVTETTAGTNTKSGNIRIPIDPDLEEAAPIPEERNTRQVVKTVNCLSQIFERLRLV
jgi:hypothetical protein